MIVPLKSRCLMMFIRDLPACHAWSHNGWFVIWDDLGWSLMIWDSRGHHIKPLWDMDEISERPYQNHQTRGIKTFFGEHIQKVMLHVIINYNNSGCNVYTPDNLGISTRRCWKMAVLDHPARTSGCPGTQRDAVAVLVRHPRASGATACIWCPEMGASPSHHGCFICFMLLQ